MVTTGPQHYILAEQLLDGTHTGALTFARAQAHATLALAAATAMAAFETMPDVDIEAWDRVAGVQDDEHDEHDEHDMRSCTECADQYEAEQAADHEMTNADVMTAEEIDADGRDAEFALDAADEARWAEAEGDAL